MIWFSLSGDSRAKARHEAPDERLVGRVGPHTTLVFVTPTETWGSTALTRRERRLACMLQDRVQEEAALRQVVRALSAAVTIDEVMRCIVEGTLATTGAYGAYVEVASSDDDRMRTCALVGAEATVHCGLSGGGVGSLTAEMRGHRNPSLVTEVESIDHRLSDVLTAADVHHAGLMAPLLSSVGETFGVLMLLRRADSEPFGENERRQIGFLSDLAAAVLRRVDVERATRVDAHQGAAYETALGEAAEALAGAFTIDDVTQQIVRSALRATRARGAWVEHVGTTADRTRTVGVRGVAGSGVPALGTARAYVGSFAEQVITGGEPVLAVDLVGADPSIPVSSLSDHASSTIVLPLGHADAPIGALYIVGAAAAFRSRGVVWADTFAHLAALAYEKVRLLDAAVDDRRELERVMRSRQRLMRGFSHDVKNPLGAADGYAELLRDGIYGDVTATQRATIDNVRRSIHGALDLIEDLHELAGAETGSLVLQRQFVNLGELARTIGEEYRGAANASGLSLDVDVASDVPPLETDAARVRQIVGNLLSNAIKYTKAGSIKLRVAQCHGVEAGAGDGWAQLDVVDSGLGIPADERDVIFEEFSRLHANDKPGAGLGLAISRRLAEALGGHISVESEVGRGSTFTLRIPLRPSDVGDGQPRLTRYASPMRSVFVERDAVDLIPRPSAPC